MQEMWALPNLRTKSPNVGDNLKRERVKENKKALSLWFGEEPVTT